MEDLPLADWGIISQLGIAAFTVVGVIASLYVSNRALREVTSDRHQRQKPHLAFDRGGYRYPVEFVKAGKSIPGINPNHVAKVFSDLPDDAESVRLKDIPLGDGKIDPIRVGKLRNYGMGPALETSVTWVPNMIWIGEEQFNIDDQKLSEPVYNKSLNTMPSIPRHILPGEKSRLSRLPTFIEKDIDKKITRVDGLLHINSVDVFQHSHLFKQEFHMFTGYNEALPWVHVTFGDMVNGHD